jgi:hypothetical protein
MQKQHQPKWKQLLRHTGNDRSNQKQKRKLTPSTCNCIQTKSTHLNCTTRGRGSKWVTMRTQPRQCLGSARNIAEAAQAQLYEDYPEAWRRRHRPCQQQTRGHPKHADNQYLRKKILAPGSPTAPATKIIPEAWPKSCLRHRRDPSASSLRAGSCTLMVDVHAMDGKPRIGVSLERVSHTALATACANNSARQRLLDAHTAQLVTSHRNVMRLPPIGLGRRRRESSQEYQNELLTLHFKARFGSSNCSRITLAVRRRTQSRRTAARANKT